MQIGAFDIVARLSAVFGPLLGARLLARAWRGKVLLAQAAAAAATAYVVLSGPVLFNAPLEEPDAPRPLKASRRKKRGGAHGSDSDSSDDEDAGVVEILKKFFRKAAPELRSAGGHILTVVVPDTTWRALRWAALPSPAGAHFSATRSGHGPSLVRENDLLLSYAARPTQNPLAHLRDCGTSDECGYDGADSGRGRTVTGWTAGATGTRRNHASYRLLCLSSCIAQENAHIGGVPTASTADGIGCRRDVARLCH